MGIAHLNANTQISTQWTGWTGMEDRARRTSAANPARTRLLMCVRKGICPDKYPENHEGAGRKTIMEEGGEGERKVAKGA